MCETHPGNGDLCSARCTLVVVGISRHVSSEQLSAFCKGCKWDFIHAADHPHRYKPKLFVCARNQCQEAVAAVTSKIFLYIKIVKGPI